MQIARNIYLYPYSPDKSIIYSPIARKMLLIDAEEADMLKCGKTEYVCPESLKANAILTKYIPVAQQPKVEKPEDYTLLTVLPTNKCNFGCSYCYAAAGRDASTLDIVRLKVAIDFFLNSKPKGFHKGLSISFMGGGEPLMAFDLVKEGTEYARERALERQLRLSVRVITNGSLVDEYFIRFCKEHKVEVSVSFDVIEEVQNSQRGKYEKVANAITTMCEAGLSVQINTTVTPLNVDSMPEMLRTIHERWPKVHAVMMEHVSGRMDMNDAQLVAFLDTYRKNFITCLKLGKDYGISVTSFAYLRTIFPLERACPGELCITSHGDITGCYCVGSPKAPLYNETKYGRVNSDGVTLDEESYRKLMDTNVYSYPECQDCEVKWNCGGGCYYQNHTNDVTYRKVMCNFTRQLVTDIIRYRVDQYLINLKENIQLPILIENKE
ncbi:MAG: radical SAM protein [Muribaculaceae bacterium]|nr:radical SAM protein [Muribaculaceae bacterium]